MDSKLKIIGLAGTNGSGKDTVGHILADKYGYLFISITDLLRDEAIRRGQPVEREILRTISAEWRRESGHLGVLVDKAVAEYENVKDQHPGGLAMSSLRNPGEADRIHELGGTVIWVDADPRIRYDRVQANVASRGRAGEDQKTFEQFLAEEQAEMNQSGDAATLDMSAVKALCDLTLNNEGDAKALQADLEHLLTDQT
jgi:cytidylate kinase